MNLKRSLGAWQSTVIGRAATKKVRCCYQNGSLLNDWTAGDEPYFDLKLILMMNL